jgi:hypothetical protein
MRFQRRSVSTLLASALVACSAAAAAPAAGDGSRQVGPFEISARIRSSGDSARFLRSGNPFGSQSVRKYQIRWMATVPVEPWLDQVQGDTVVNMNASNSPAVALSPGRTRFVLRGEGQDYGRGGECFDLLLLIDLATGKPEALRLDPRRTPYANLDAIDAAWIATHLQWTRGPDGRERLQPLRRSARFGGLNGRLRAQRCRDRYETTTQTKPSNHSACVEGSGTAPAISKEMPPPLSPYMPGASAMPKLTFSACAKCNACGESVAFATARADAASPNCFQLPFSMVPTEVVPALVCKKYWLTQPPPWQHDQASYR